MSIKLTELSDKVLVIENKASFDDLEQIEFLTKSFEDLGFKVIWVSL